jgi:gamma-glutamylaminecyclotransferase
VSQLLFVYGTLKRGAKNHRHMAGQRFVGESRTIPGYELRDMGGYPGLVSHPEDARGVTGEVWSVDEAALRRLDRFEGVDQGLYRRDRISLTGEFATQQIDAYFPVQPVQGPSLGATWREA